MTSCHFPFIVLFILLSAPAYLNFLWHSLAALRNTIRKLFCLLFIDFIGTTAVRAHQKLFVVLRCINLLRIVFCCIVMRIKQLCWAVSKQIKHPKHPLHYLLPLVEMPTDVDWCLLWHTENDSYGAVCTKECLTFCAVAIYRII